MNLERELQKLHNLNKQKANRMKKKSKIQKIKGPVGI